MAIKCVSAYQSSAGAWAIGQVVEDPRLAAWLLRDSPGSWEDVAAPKAPEPEPEIVTKPIEAEETKPAEAPATKPVGRGNWRKGRR